MEELVATLIRLFVEILIQVLANLGTWPSSGKEDAEPQSAIAGSFAWFMVGIGIGIVWALVFPYFILPTADLRLINLIVGPVVSAYVGYLISRSRAKENANIRVWNHFWYSYWFTLGVIAARYGYTYHSLLGPN